MYINQYHGSRPPDIPISINASHVFSDGDEVPTCPDPSMGSRSPAQTVPGGGNSPV